MKPGIKRLIIFLFVLSVFAVLLAIAIGYFTEDKIKEIAVEQLNTSLNTEVTVEQIEFSLLQRFPKASIQFKSIAIREKTSRKNPDNLIEAKSLFLEFDPFDLLTGNYTINQITISDADINIKYFSDGSENFRFFSGSENEAFSISLEKVSIKKSVILYRDDRKNVVIEKEIDKLILSGDFENDDFDLNISSDGILNRFRNKSYSLAKAYPLKLNLIINVKAKSGIYSIKKANATLKELTLALNGSYQHKANQSIYDLNFRSEEFRLISALEFLPKKIRQKLSGPKSKGSIQLDGSLQGILDEKSFPSLDVSFDLKNGNLSDPKLNINLKEISFSGQFSNGKQQNTSSSILTVDSLSFKGKYGLSTGSFTIKNFEKPYLTFHLSSNLNLEELHQSLSNDSIEKMQGICEYEISGETGLDSLSSFSAQDLKSMKASGSLTLTNGYLKWKGYKYPAENVTAKARFGNNIVYLDTLGYSVAELSSSVKGELVNFLPYLFFKNENVQAKASIFYPELNLDKLVSETENNDRGAFLPFSEKIRLDLKFSVGELTLSNFSATNVNCDLISAYPVLIARNLTLNSMGGRYEGWTKFVLNQDGSAKWTSDLTLSDVNIQQLFYQFNDFGQQAIIHENIDGKADATIAFQADLNESLDIKQKSVKTRAHIDIRQGALINYEPMLALSKYVDVEELQEIKFSRLSNDIEIKDRMIYIPEMEIKSSALELKLSGKHSFDNDIDYHFQLWLNDFLFRKAKRSKKNKEEFGEIETDKEGRAKLFIRMVGTVDDYKIKLDRKALREKWKEDFKEERSELKEIFKEEFGKKEKDVEQMEFEVEWEDDRSKEVRFRFHLPLATV